MAMLSVLKIKAKIIDVCMWTANMCYSSVEKSLELNFTSTIWRPSYGEMFSIFSFSNKNVFYKFCYCTIKESI
jgi:hypothetical protein